MSRWHKHDGNPVLGPGYCIEAVFDCCVIPESDRLRMWFSWRDLRSIAYAESTDGVHWTPPRIVLEVDRKSGWETSHVSRPHVLKAGEAWYMWYTGRNSAERKGSLGLATSQDGEHWERSSANPVLSPEAEWEKKSIMCAHVLYELGGFRMWYSAGDWIEPDSIGYASSDDGLHWRRDLQNPIFRPTRGWESDRVTAFCVVPRESDYLAFYIGFADGLVSSQIGMARSKDGIHDWERYPHNPIINPGPPGAWDDYNVYKPYVIPYQGQWYLWYNASRQSDHREQIGLATTERLDF